jgi:hypothetical protein
VGEVGGAADDAVAAGVFGRVEAGVGAGEGVEEALVVEVDADDADADGDVEGALGGVDGSGVDGLAEAFGDDLGGALEVGLGEHDRELFAAVAAGDVAAAQAGEDALGDRC